MNTSTYLRSYLLCKNIGEESIRAVSGALVNELPLDKPIPRGSYADIIYEEAIPSGKLPAEPVVKMSKAKHVDSFFQIGSLRLGTFSYYNEFDHEEIGDSAEGSFVLVGQNPPTTAFAKMKGGFNNYVFCCYAGEADDACLDRFGYDSGFRISDVESFAEAVGSKIGAKKFWFSKCSYSEDKVLVGDVSEYFDFNVLSGRLLHLANEAKYFVKPDTYSHQSEFRFVWQMPSDVDDPLDIQCPEAIQYCQKLDTETT